MLATRRPLFTRKRFPTQAMEIGLAPSAYLMDWFRGQADGTALTSHTIEPVNIDSRAWTAIDGTFTILDGKANCATLASGVARVVVETGHANGVIEGVWRAKTDGADVGVMFRWSSTSDHWILLFDPASFGLLRLAKVVGGAAPSVVASNTNVGNGTNTDPETDYRYRIVFNGPSIEVAFFGRGIKPAYLSATDSFNSTATMIGLRGATVGDQWAEFTFEPIDPQGLKNHSTLNNGCVAFWPMNERVSNSNDSAFRRDTALADWNNYLMAMGTEGPRSVSDGPGGRNAARLERAKQQHFVPEMEWACFLSPGDRDYEGHFFIRLRSNSVTQGIFGQRSRAPAKWHVDYENTTNRYRFFIFDSAGNVAGSVSTTVAPTLDVWQRVDFWHDNTANQICIALDGTAATPVTLTAVPAPTAIADFMIGNMETQSASDFHGDFDICLVGLWWRLLTAGEKTDLAAGGNGLDFTIPGEDYFTRHGWEPAWIVPVTRLAAVHEGGRDAWDTRQGGSPLIAFIDVDNDGEKELMVVINRKPHPFIFKRDGSVLKKNTTVTTNQDQAAYLIKINEATNHVYIGHMSLFGPDDSSHDKVYAYNYATNAMDWTYAVPTNGLLRCLELTSRGLAIGNDGPNSQIDIVDYLTGLTVGGGWPVSFSPFTQWLANGVVPTHGEILIANNFTTTPTACSMVAYRVSDGNLLWTKTTPAAHIDIHRIADLSKNGVNRILTVWNTGQPWAFEGRILTCLDHAGNTVWEHTAPADFIYEVQDFYPGEPDLKIVYATAITDGLPGEITIAMVNGADGSQEWSKTFRVGVNGGGQVQVGDFAGTGTPQVWTNTGDNRGAVNYRMVGIVVFNDLGEYVRHLFGCGWDPKTHNAAVNRNGGGYLLASPVRAGSSKDAVTGTIASIDNTGRDIVMALEIVA